MPHEPLSVTAVTGRGAISKEAEWPGVPSRTYYCDITRPRLAREAFQHDPQKSIATMSIRPGETETFLQAILSEASREVWRLVGQYVEAEGVLPETQEVAHVAAT